MMLWLLTGCGLLAPTLPPLDTSPQTVHVEPIATWATDATLPTDLLVLSDERVVALDGRAGRLVFVAEPGPVAVSSEALTGAVRLSVASDEGSVWAARPDHSDVVRVSLVDGTLLESHAVHGAPTSVLAVDDALLVGTRTGELLWVSADGTARAAEHVHHLEERPLGSIADLIALPDGGIAVSDALGPAVHRLDPDGTCVMLVDRRGPWVGGIVKPKGLAVTAAGDLLVVDSSQGAVQLFDSAGQALGVLDTEPFVHPIDVAVLGERVFVLDQDDGTVRVLTLSAAAVSEARTGAEVRHIRHPLIAPRAANEDGDARLCRQCHDGFVEDARDAWDPSLVQHPIGVTPHGVDVPDTFPLDDDGALRCATCHSPHALTGEAARAKEEGGDLFLRATRADGALCVACHGDTAHETALLASAVPNASMHPSGQDLVRALAGRPGSSALGLPAGVDGTCLDCHAVHGGETGSLKRGTSDGRTCRGCHADVGHGGHPIPERDTCSSCHQMVGGSGESLLRALVSTCVQCHADPLSTAHAGTACLDCHEVHAQRTLRAGATRCASCHADHPAHHPGACADCHGGHHTPEVDRTCASCHQDVHLGGPHGAMACVDCHDPHTAPRRAPTVRGANVASAPCLACHGAGAVGSATQVTRISHPKGLFLPPDLDPEALRLFDAAGKRVPPGEQGALSCASCHSTHDGPTVRPGVVAVCESCHWNSGAEHLRDFHRRGAR